MANIFLSHSSQDNDYAQKVKDFLNQTGNQSVFLDFDPNYGIPAGRDWEKELYNNLRKCQVVIVLYSKFFSSSQWCFAEITHARALGKFMIPIRIDDCEVNSLLMGIQIIDATTNQEGAFQRLANGLLVAGIDKNVWDNSRPPYPGLFAFDELDAPIFFGREAETEDLLKSLRQYRSFGGPKVLLVLGASGSGKSSLIRAGVIPKLRKDQKSWIIVGPLRPLKKPFDELCKSIAKIFNQFKDNRTWQDIYKALKVDDSVNPKEIATILSQILNELTGLSKETSVTLLIFIDQFEELLNDNHAMGNKFITKNIEYEFIACLRFLADSADNKLLIISTLRSDFLGKYQDNSNLKGLAFSDYIVKSVNHESLRSSITEPAKVAGIELEEGLADILLKDTGTSDALPLLAFTLRELWEQYADDGILSIEEYRNKLGGLEGSVARVAEAVLISFIAQTGRGKIINGANNENNSTLKIEDENLVKAAFMAMVRIDEEGRYTRRFAKWEELPIQVTDLLQRFVTARLIVVSGNGKNSTIEVAHEALFRTWGRLVKWLEEDKNFLIWRKSLNAALNEWTIRNKNESELLRGPALAESIELLQQNKLGNHKLTLQEIQFIEASNYKDKEIKLKEEKRRLKELRNLRLLFAGAIIVLVIILGFGYWIYQNNINTRNDLAKSFWDKSRTANEKNNSLAALFYISEGLSLSKDKVLNKKMLLDIESFTPSTMLKTIISHDSIVNTAVFSPDGKQVLTASYDKTARLWDAKTGTPIGSPMKHDAAVYSALFSPDGKRVLTSSSDKTARLWDAKTGASLGSSMKHNDIVTSAVFSPDGTQVLTASSDGTARLWDATTGVSLGSPMKHDAAVYSAAFSPNGQQVVTASLDSTARVWDAKTGTPIGSPMVHDDAVVIAVFSPDGKQMLAASWDGTAWLWDAKTGSSIGSPMEHAAAVNSAVFNLDGTQVLTAANDGTSRLWDAKTGKPLGAPMVHAAAVNRAVFSPDGKLVLTASSDGTARILDAKTGVFIGSPIVHAAAVNSAVFSSDGKLVLTSSNDGTARIFDAKTDIYTGSPMVHAAAVNSAVFSLDGKLVLTSSNDGTARIFDAKTGISIGSPMKHDNIVKSAVFSPDGKQVLTASSNKTARLWDGIKGISIYSPMVHAAAVYIAVFSPDGKLVLTASWDSTARLWDATTGTSLGLPMKHNRVINTAVFSPDGKQVLTASSDGTARLWDAKTGVSIGSRMKHNKIINTAVFSPDGKQVLTASSDGTARLWDAKTGRSIGSGMKHDKIINTAVFSPDGKQVVTASWEGIARLWDAKTGASMGSPMKHAAAVYIAVFSPDGKLVLTASNDGTARLWDAKTGASIGSPMKHTAAVYIAVFSPDGKQILTASGDNTARLWDVEGDFDISADLFKLEVVALTGVELNMLTGETNCIPVEQFEKLKAEYFDKGGEHYKECKYPRHNLWSRFYPEESKKVKFN